MAVPMAVVKGNHYQVGFQIGSTFKDRIMKATLTAEYRNKQLLQEFGGQTLYDCYLAIVKSIYPQYIEELQGMADGSSLSFEQLFINMMSVELESQAEYGVGVDHGSQGCTDLLLKTDTEVLITHSEDTDEPFTEGFLVNAEITNKDGTKEKFISYCDPGVLPCDTFAFNYHGLVITGNVIFQVDLKTNAIVRRFVSRALLSASSLEEVVNIIKKAPGVASAFHLNLGFLGSQGKDPELYSVEFANSENGSLVDVQKYEGFNSYFNVLTKLDIKHNEASTESSVHRAARVNELPTPKNSTEMLKIMSDTANKDFPIYRNGRKPDCVVTAAIAAFDLKRETLSVFKGNPKNQDYKPCIVLPLKF
ncbi:beta-alanyl-dopamine/carcinine hydrolase-like isoform X2 [Glandiceps talaboti]